MKRYIRSNTDITFNSKSQYFQFLDDEYGDDIDMAYGDMCGEVASERFDKPVGVPEIFGKIGEDVLLTRYISWRRHNNLPCN